MNNFLDFLLEFFLLESAPQNGTYFSSCTLTSKATRELFITHNAHNPVPLNASSRRIAFMLICVQPVIPQDCPLPPQEELNDITAVHLTEVHHTHSSVEIQIQFCLCQATLYGINAAHISWKLLHGKFHL